MLTRVHYSRFEFSRPAQIVDHQREFDGLRPRAENCKDPARFGQLCPFRRSLRPLPATDKHSPAPASTVVLESIRRSFEQSNDQKDIYESQYRGVYLKESIAYLIETIELCYRGRSDPSGPFAKLGSD